MKSIQDLGQFYRMPAKQVKLGDVHEVIQDVMDQRLPS
jgi:hypothetical protein